MPSDYELTISRYQTFLRDVLDPAVYPAAAPLQVLAHQLPDPKADPITPAAALALTFSPVEIGWNWGPKWSSTWFRIQGAVPATMKGRSVCLRFSSGTEAQVWTLAGGAWTPLQGLDVNRDRLPLFESAAGGEPVDILIEAACNHPFGVTGFEWDGPEVHARWNSPTPGRLERAELAVFDADAWRLRHSYAFALGLLKELPENSNRAQDLFGALRRATNACIPGNPSSVKNSQEILDESLSRAAAGSTTTCHAVGHAHIDTAWLWPIRETKRKCLRSFSNQLRLMEQYPEYNFLCSQAQQYAWVEENSPELFAQISARVAEGRWEPGGAMWIEPDANCPSGESLVRQILHGTRYWTTKFGEKAAQTFLYLPDTFGFPASLPQIMTQAGLSMFITNKMIWNRSNVFPHTTFVWTGIDGSSVLAHNTPGHDYNAVNTPKELHRGEINHRNRDRVQSQDGGAIWLQPFGFGDGGGGPTDWSILNAQLAADCDGMPRVKLSTVADFIEEVTDRAAQSFGTPEALPEWSGELYLEIHRGTLTSQAWIKAANRRAEEDLRFCELLTFAGPVRPAPDAAKQAAAKLDTAWKTLLLNQFHDILPGSSIGWVYEDSRRDFARINKVTDALTDKGTTAWLSALSTKSMKKPVGVFNPCSVPRSGVVDIDDEPAFVRSVPALGVAVTDRSLPHGCVPVTVEDHPNEDSIVLSNGLVRAEIDFDGTIRRLSRAGGRELAEFDALTKEHLPINELVLYEDIPHMWDAWDIDPSYIEKPIPVNDPDRVIEIVSEHPLRCAVRVTQKLGESSRIEQTYVLDAGSPRIDVISKVNWRESRKLLRALFPIDVRANNATYDIQFGHIQRPTHRNTTWDAAKFEVCAHRWMDLSDRGAGLSILNDSKYGHSCHGNVLGLSLLRAPKHPDPNADIGEHEFTYSLMPHDGDWRAAGVDREAEALNNPLLAYALTPDEDGPLGTSWSPFNLSCDSGVAVAIAAFKRAEGSDQLILRLWESHAGRGTLCIRWNLPVKSVTPVNLLESPTELDGFEHNGNTTRITLRAFQIVSLAVTLA
ncbi:MAG: alpha-mannosidase [Planctomycetes bacterium]|nr:alpha-mannosidase [Planctomycetota bacterium]